ncbi:MAG: hypothetical protein GC149_00905 [Gammaproteobacteria bacterium]|nr:hypothetical protein [Gammaproteobacteria bacterium]
MELAHLQQSLYPRAVTASGEGNLRRDGQEREFSPGHASSVKKQSSMEAQQQRLERVRRDDAERRGFEEQAVRQYQAQQDPDTLGYTNASVFGDRLAMASRQARQSQARRGYVPPAMVSARGREANRSYLDVANSHQPRFIDEIV